MPYIEFNELKNISKRIFSIWPDSPELMWAEAAWSILRNQGLTQYENELNKQIIILRLFILGTLYHEFCYFAFDEYSAFADDDAISEYSDWLDTFNKNGQFISTFRLGQLTGSSYRANEKITDEADEATFINESIIDLIEQQREIVVYALIKGFKTKSGLFASLWLSNEPLNKDDGFDDIHSSKVYKSFEEKINDNGLFNDVESNKGRAFEWIEADMPPLQSFEDFSSSTSDCGSIIDMINNDENSKVEYKSGLYFNIHNNKKDEDMKMKVVRAVASFINSEGGTVLIGVDDNRKILGINHEYAIVNSQKPNRDGYQLFLSDVLRKNIDFGLIHLVTKINICEVDGKDICMIKVSKSPSIDFAYVENEFFTRQNNRTIKLTGKELISHSRIATIAADYRLAQVSRDQQEKG